MTIYLGNLLASISSSAVFKVASSATAVRCAHVTITYHDLNGTIMLDFFTIFSKGGILLWCFKGIGIDQKHWEAFNPSVNAFIKSVLLQVTCGA